MSGYNNLELPDVARDPVYPKRLDIIVRPIDYTILFVLLIGFLVINILGLVGVIAYKSVVVFDTTLIASVLVIMLQPFYFMYRNSKRGLNYTLVGVNHAYADF